VKTPASNVSASLSRVTRADQRFVPFFRDLDFLRRLAMALANASKLVSVPSLAWAQLRVKFIQDKPGILL